MLTGIPSANPWRRARPARHLIAGLSITAHLLASCASPTTAQNQSEVSEPEAAPQKIEIVEGERAVALAARFTDPDGITRPATQTDRLVLAPRGGGPVRELALDTGGVAVYSLPTGTYSVEGIAGYACGTPSFFVPRNKSPTALGTLELNTTEAGDVRFRSLPPTAEEIQAIADLLNVAPVSINAAPIENRNWSHCKVRPAMIASKDGPMNASDAVAAAGLAVLGIVLLFPLFVVAAMGSGSIDYNR